MFILKKHREIRLKSVQINKSLYTDVAISILSSIQGKEIFQNNLNFLSCIVLKYFHSYRGSEILIFSQCPFVTEISFS